MLQENSAKQLLANYLLVGSLSVEATNGGAAVRSRRLLGPVGKS
jgi:hypothetical protein